jgi:hypothetical protein
MSSSNSSVSEENFAFKTTSSNNKTISHEIFIKFVENYTLKPSPKYSTNKYLLDTVKTSDERFLDASIEFNLPDEQTLSLSHNGKSWKFIYGDSDAKYYKSYDYSTDEAKKVMVWFQLKDISIDYKHHHPLQEGFKYLSDGTCRFYESF